MALLPCHLLLQRALSGRACHALACRAPPFSRAPHRVHMFVKATRNHGHHVPCQSNPHMDQHKGARSHSRYLQRPSPTTFSSRCLSCCIYASHRHSGSWPPLLKPTAALLAWCPAALAPSELSSTPPLPLAHRHSQVTLLQSCARAGNTQWCPLLASPHLPHLPCTSQHQHCLMHPSSVPVTLFAL